MNENKEVIRKQIGDYSFDMNDIIGEGYSSKVYKGIHMATHQVVAIKVISLETYNSPIQKSLLSNEIKILLQIDNPNLLRVYEISQSANNTYIVSEYCEGASLEELLKQEPMKTEKVIDILTQICKGLLGLHQKNIIHRDIKPANVLIKNDIFKLVDFGFALIENQYDSILKRYNVGTPLYMAPEIHLLNQYSEKSDVWALGIMLHEMLFKAAPKFKFNDQTLMQEIKENCQTLDIINSKLIVRLLEGMLQLEPEDRITIQQILQILQEHQSSQSSVSKQASHLVKLSQKSVSTQVNSPLQSKGFRSPNEIRKKYVRQRLSDNKPLSFDDQTLANLVRVQAQKRGKEFEITQFTYEDEVPGKSTGGNFNQQPFRYSHQQSDSEINIELIEQISTDCSVQKSSKQKLLSQNRNQEIDLPVILKPTYEFCEFIEQIIQNFPKQDDDLLLKMQFLLRKLLAIKAKVFYTFAPLKIKSQLDNWISQLQQYYQKIQCLVNLNLDKTFQLFFNSNLDDQGKLLTMYIISLANQMVKKSNEIKIVIEILEDNLQHQNDPFLFARKWVFQKSS
ncbi:unnamed protein product (macronuclear) [Paramecium tetraurelia]|uniref:Protein kinase domain-containing protein n=1 Tax=Paramecium tetraurelia TaxID=5888 RepID=A0DFJ5_PARTE|nr:uncharacterized protein GSPATT00016625001 [Paramecium tetraurelia]CAK81812.1 unnamed protein product [Paramecium tetraurelia]|eukprot:XP_001449209.1 hypothetical protein (macronuclear) [Paramecium tetraurelia strain d4-2]